MAVVTGFGRCDVPGTFTLGGPAVMATGTILWCAFKYALDVAGITIHADMGATEGKSGREVIEIQIHRTGVPAY